MRPLLIPSWTATSFAITWSNINWKLMRIKSSRYVRVLSLLWLCTVAWQSNGRRYSHKVFGKDSTPWFISSISRPVLSRGNEIMTRLRGIKHVRLHVATENTGYQEKWIFWIVSVWIKPNLYRQLVRVFTKYDKYALKISESQKGPYPSQVVCVSLIR